MLVLAIAIGIVLMVLGAALEDKVNFDTDALINAGLVVLIVAPILAVLCWLHLTFTTPDKLIQKELAYQQACLDIDKMLQDDELTPDQKTKLITEKLSYIKKITKLESKLAGRRTWRYILFFGKGSGAPTYYSRQALDSYIRATGQGTE